MPREIVERLLALPPAEAIVALFDIVHDIDTAGDEVRAGCDDLVHALDAFLKQQMPTVNAEAETLIHDEAARERIRVTMEAE
jgi:hypothetical protein